MLRGHPRLGHRLQRGDRHEHEACCRRSTWSGGGSRSRSRPGSARAPPPAARPAAARPPSSGSLGASNSANGAAPGRSRTPTRRCRSPPRAPPARRRRPLAPAILSCASSAAGADGRVPGERHLGRRRENAHARGVRGVLRLQHEHRLGQVELARDRLHARAVEPVGVEHHRQRVAAEALVGEHVEDVIVEAASPRPRAS